jgi:hypothetical protein
VYFSRVLPLDHVRIDGARLSFDDLGVMHGFSTPRTYAIEWHGFDNAKDTLSEVIGVGPDIPPAAQALAAGSYGAARIHAGSAATSVTAYLRRAADGFHVVGLDRSWPGKVVAYPPPPPRATPRVFADLAPRQQELFATYTERYNEARNTRYTPEETFGRLTISEQTTFYGITHALLHSDLTDASGAALGKAIDRVATVERIAGQYAGKGGDEQFRLYVTLKPDTRDVLEKSREVFRDHENTVYHIGYPHSYRQTGKPPTFQFSVSDDWMKADIDVDYRSDKSPGALFNGHLTAANSDVRAGVNPKVHSARWSGLVPFWQQLFGNLADAGPSTADVLNAQRPDNVPTPLPPDRPKGASPEKVEDASQEFLTDWLVRHEYDQAIEFLSPQAFACLNLTDDARGQPLDAAAARRELLKLMEFAASRLGVRPESEQRHHGHRTEGPRSADHRLSVQARVPARTRSGDGSAPIPLQPIDSSAGGRPVLRRHLPVPHRRRRCAGPALGPRKRQVEDRVVPAAQSIAHGSMPTIIAPHGDRGVGRSEEGALKWSRSRRRAPLGGQRHPE